jgi:WD40 repeat protein
MTAATSAPSFPADRHKQRSRLLPPLPYPGIRPFRKEEWPIFCGRQQIVDELLQVLGDARFLPVVGTSGCGKSSIIKAGLIATLEREHGALGANWQTVEMRPGNSPMWHLADALWTATVGPTGGSAANAPAQIKGTPEEIAKIRSMLGRGPGGIERVLRARNFAQDRDLLLLVDQFEELFRFASLGGDSEVESFIDQLVDVFDGRPHGIHVVLTMRADFIADCARWPRLAAALNRTAYLLRWMTEDELREAIITPAKLYRGEIEPKLVDRIIRDAGGKPDQLPVIQHALMWMWIRTGKSTDAVLTLKDYEGEEVGGLDGALSRHADQIYDQLANASLGGTQRDLRPIARRVFQSLTDIDANGRAIRRPCLFGELRAVAGCEARELQYVIDQFRKPGCSFLMPDEMRELTDTDPIDVSHEALIRQWSKMRTAAGEASWVEEEKQDSDTWRALAREAEKYGRNTHRRLSTDQNPEFQAWWKERQPTAAWASRYTSNAASLFDHAQSILRLSALRQKRNATIKWGAIGALLLALIAGPATVYYRKAAEADSRAQALAEETQRQRDDEWATRAVDSWQITDALVLMQKTLDSRPGSATEATGYRALTRFFLDRQYEDAYAADWTPDGLTAALGRGNHVRVIDVLTGTEATKFDISGEIYNMAMSVTGFVAINDNASKNVEIWRVSPAPAEKLTSFPVDGTAANLYFSPNGRWLGISDNNTVRIVDASTWQVASQWNSSLEAGCLIFGHDSEHVATVSYDGQIVIASLSPVVTRQYDQQLEGPGGGAGETASWEPVGLPVFDRTRPWLAIPMAHEATATIKIVNFETKTTTEVAPGAFPTAATFSVDGKWLAIGGDDRVLRILDAQILEDRAAVASMSSQNWTSLQDPNLVGSPKWLAFSPDSSRLLADTGDGAAVVIDPRSGLTHAVMRATTAIMYPTFINGGSHVISMGEDSIFRVWSMEPKQAPQPFAVNGGWARLVLGPPARMAGTKEPTRQAASIAQVAGLAYEDSKRSVLTSVQTKSGIDVTLLRADASDSSAGSLPPLEDKKQMISVAANGLAIGGVDVDGRVWTSSVGGRDWTLLGSLDSAPSENGNVPLVVSKDGSILVVAGKVFLFKKNDERQEVRSVDAKDSILAADVASDRLLIATNVGKIRLISTNSSKMVELQVRDPTDTPLAGALSGDGKFAAVTGKSGIVDVWEIDERPSLLATMGEPYHRLLMPAFPPDGNAIDVISEDGTIYRWALYPDRQPLVQKVNSAIDTLSDAEVKQLQETRRAQNEPTDPPAE